MELGHLYKCQGTDSVCKATCFPTEADRSERHHTSQLLQVVSAANAVAIGTIQHSADQVLVCSALNRMARPSSQDPFYLIKTEIQESVGWVPGLPSHLVASRTNVMQDSGVVCVCR